jgi:2-dehydropantoate 2-reductase
MRVQDHAELKVAIVGAGAVGLALGSCLHEAAGELTFVARKGRASSEALATLRADGLRRTGIFGEVHVPGSRIAIADGLEALAEREWDALLICTKTTATRTLASELGALWTRLRGEPRVVLCQNGWGNAERFAAHLPREQIDNARIITGFRRLAPNHVDVTVHADAIHLGSLFGPPAALLDRLAAAIARDIPCAVTPDIEGDLWAKVLYNCLLNPLGALLGVPYGVLGESERTRAIMERVAREIFAVLARSGYHTHWDGPDAYLETFFRELLPATASHESSMLQDLRAGRPTEIDALCGAVVRLGAEHGVDTPVNLALADLVGAAERREG